MTKFLQISNDGIDADIRDETDATAGHGTATINVDGSTADGANDFNQINAILGAMVAKARADVEEVSPWINLLDHLAPAAENRFINFSLDKARKSAWCAVI